MTELSDAEVFGPQKEMSDDQVFGDRMPDALQTTVPEAFLDRVRAGQALTRITMAAIKEGKEGMGQATPTGLEDETLNHLVDMGVFHDPASGRGGPIQTLNEAVLMPTAQLWQAITRATSGAIHGAGGAMGQVVEEFGGSQGMANRAKNEVINAGNWAMIEGGMGRFSRPAATPAGVADQPIGGLPRPEDFATAGKVMESPHAEANLKRMWSEDGIHPAEAVHDAQADAFIKNEITAAREEVKLPLAEEELLTETGGKPGDLGAAATDPPDVSPAVQPLRPPGRLAAALQSAGETLLDIGRDAQMLTAPMATGTRDSMAMAKDFASSLRRNRWDWSRTDKDIADRFTPEQRARMWTAADEESMSLQLGEPAHMREHQGLATLAPEERAAVVELQTRAQNAWVRARDAGMVEGEGLPAYTPRMIINTVGTGAKETVTALDGKGYNLKTRTGNMLKRKYMEAQDTEAAAKAKYGDQAMLARDIRVLPLAVSQLEDAIAGRTLINNIREYGKQTGTDTVSEGAIPAGGDVKWFTLDHPSFRTWRPKIGEDAEGNRVALKDGNDNMIFEQVPLYVHGDFEGPLRAVLSQKSGPLYGAAMALKGKTMSLIMNSPMIHNAVEWGRALPAMPGKVVTFKVYFEGNRAKNNVPLMHEAIDAGLVPIGHRFFNQDITSVMESPDLTPGRSWTAKVLGFVPGLFDEGAGTAVKTAIDKAGDFWHNKLLWDRVADLQMGLYVNFRADAIAHGIDPQTSARMAAHWANRYAGALPKEAMSDGATKVANMLLFSRSFTMGNLGVLKDVFTGLPKDVIAQIERDAGFGKGSIDAAPEYTVAFRKPTGEVISGKKGEIHTDLAERKGLDIFADVSSGEHLEDGFSDKGGNFFSRQEMADKKLPETGEDLRDIMTTKDAVKYAKSMARRKAMSVVALDMGLMYVGNSLLQNAMNVMWGDSSLDKEMHGYAERFANKMQAVKEHPLELIQPLKLLGDLSSTSENEPGKGDRIRIGYAKDGTAIYARNPAGKIGDEFAGYMTGPLDMMRRKLGTIARPAWQIMSNDAGFGRKVYDPDADTPARYLANLGRIARHIAGSQLPEGQMGAVRDLVTGQGDAKVNALQALGPFAGVTFSKGAPGGPAVGEMYANKAQFEFRVQQAMPDVRRQIQRGDIAGAQQKMTEVGMDPSYQRWVVKTTLNPATRIGTKALQDFYRTASPEARARFARDRTPMPTEP